MKHEHTDTDTETHTHYWKYSILYNSSFLYLVIGMILSLSCEVYLNQQIYIVDMGERRERHTTLSQWRHMSFMYLNHCRLGYSFNSLFRLTAKRPYEFRLTLEGDAFGHRWFPLKKVHWCGKRFHVMMSSCQVNQTTAVPSEGGQWFQIGSSHRLLRLQGHNLHCIYQGAFWAWA